MRMTKEHNDKRTEILSYVLENLVSTHLDNVTPTLTLPQRSGGEMYGM